MTARRCLIVTAHPLRQSLCHHLADRAEAAARDAGMTVERLDLAQTAFDPRLTEEERASYYADFQPTVPGDAAQLARAEMLILVFPTWWSGFPAVLKGWFDRVWAPGTAFDHSPGFGPMIPRLQRLDAVLAVTTQGGPAWIDWLVLRRPLRRILRLGILRPCAPRARLHWRALYKAETAGAERVADFAARVEADVAALARDTLAAAR
ncbi:MAG: NAD(P)H-dependent oxidoreductase [Rhodobacteraceae bacterium]|jgi:NAD(P)H dehydrogenase (quinone)|nr:NAD(P)H-dependent oxidoreductase [Paracoccaceae bacterium]